MKITLIVFVLLTSHLHGLGQSYWSNRYDLDDGNDYAFQIAQSNDKLIVLVKALCQNNTRFCEGLMCIDLEGTLDWEVVMYDTLVLNYFESMLVRGDSIIVNMNYVQVPDKEYTLVFYDLQGNKLGQHDYFHPSLPAYRFARGLTGGQSRTFVNFTIKSDSSLPRQEIIRAYDVHWNTLWNISVPNTYLNPLRCDSEATRDNGVVVSYVSYDAQTQDRIATIEKYDSTGDMEWQTVLPHSAGFFSNSVKMDLHHNNGYVGIWEFDTFGLQVPNIPTLVFRLDSMGSVDWERIELNEQIQLFDIFTTRNGDIVGCGIAEDWPWDNNDPEYRVAYIIRMDSLGNKIWDRRIQDDREGAFQFDLYSGIELTNGDLVFAGEIKDSIYGTVDDPTPTNVWVIKLDSNGCMNETCDDWLHITTSLKEANRDDLPFVIYPNPAKDRIIVGQALGATMPNGPYTLRLSNLSGVYVLVTQLDHTRINEFDISHLHSGQYIVEIFNSSELITFSSVLIVN